MKKFTKICLIVFAACSILGVAFLMGGLLAGGTMTEVAAAFRRGDFTWGSSDGWEYSEDYEEADDIEEKIDDIEEAIDDGNEESDKSAETSSETGTYSGIRKLDVEMAQGAFYIEESEDDQLKVEVEGYKGKQTTVKQDGRELKIQNSFKGNYRGSVTLYCPKDLEFDEADISVGAGGAVLDAALQAKELDVEIGAGRFESNEEITAQTSDWNVGMGEIIIYSLTCPSIEMECSAGTIEAEINGKEKEYNSNLECGVGSIHVGETELDGVGQKQISNNEKNTNKIKAEVSVGTIDITFAK